MKRIIPCFLPFLFLFFAQNSLAQSCLGGVTYTVTLRICEGIEKPIMPAFSVSPNPANTSLNIQFNDEMHYDLILTDITGKQLLVINNVSKSYSLKTASFANGVYFLRIENSENKFWIKKIEIQNN